jgi:S1-C subfamily serine protease
MEQHNAALFQKAQSAVCFISTEFGSIAKKHHISPEKWPEGVGTGFVWDKKGHIVTNFHVINQAETVSVTLTRRDGTKKQYAAKLTGVDPDMEIAVLKIEAPEVDLQVLPMGDNAKTSVGQFSFAIGNPFGQDHSLSAGIISGMDREITTLTGKKIEGVFQTDAAINPGNSGGPLLDSHGSIIGINTAIIGSKVSAGVGLAIPIALARPSIEQVIKYGHVQRAVLGVMTSKRAPSAAESVSQGFPRVETGMVVLAVPKGSPAEIAGIQPVRYDVDSENQRKAIIGDVIVAINMDAIRDSADLDMAMKKYKPGDKVKVTVLRGYEQEKKTLSLQLSAISGETYTKIQSERAARISR